MTLEEALKRLEWKAQDLKKFSDDGRYMGLRSELSSGTCYELGVEILQEIAAIKEALAHPEQDKERCVGCEACIDTACGRDECPKGWPKASQPEQEPVVIQYASKAERDLYEMEDEDDTTTLQRKPLTKSQVLDLWEQTYVQRGSTGIEFARAIEAAHGIKE